MLASPDTTYPERLELGPHPASGEPEQTVRTDSLAADWLGVDVNVAARVMERATRGGVMVSGTALDQLDQDDLVTLGVAAKHVHWPVFAGKPAGLPPDLAIYRIKPSRATVSDLSGFDSADDKSPQA